MSDVDAAIKQGCKKGSRKFNADDFSFWKKTFYSVV